MIPDQGPMVFPLPFPFPFPLPFRGTSKVSIRRHGQLECDGSTTGKGYTQC